MSTLLLVTQSFGHSIHLDVGSAEVGKCLHHLVLQPVLYTRDPDQAELSLHAGVHLPHKLGPGNMLT